LRGAAKGKKREGRRETDQGHPTSIKKSEGAEQKRMGHYICNATRGQICPPLYT